MSRRTQRPSPFWVLFGSLLGPLSAVRHRLRSGREIDHHASHPDSSSHRQESAPFAQAHQGVGTAKGLMRAGSLMRSEVRTAFAVFGGAAMLVLAVGCGGGGNKAPSSTTTPTTTTTPSSSVAPAPSTTPGTETPTGGGGPNGGGGSIPGGPTGSGGPNGGGGSIPGVGGGGGGPGGGGGCVGNVCGGYP